MLEFEKSKLVIEQNFQSVMVSSKCTGMNWMLLGLMVSTMSTQYCI